MDAKEYESTLSNLRDKIKSYPNFPKQGILFRDIFSILRDPACLKDVLDLMLAKIKELGWDDVDIIVGLESRGFILAPLLALKLNAGFVPVRKKGRLPGSCKEIAYTLEYRTDVLEIQEESILPGQKVLVVDDLVATGGTLGAACKLLKSINANIVGCLALLELEQLEGYKNVDAPVKCLISF